MAQPSFYQLKKLSRRAMKPVEYTKDKTMAEMKKDSNYYAAFERICPMLRAADLNLTTDAACAGIGEAFVNTIIDELAKAEKPIDGLEWLMSGEAGAKEVRIEIFQTLKGWHQACNNLQNTYLAPAGLMPKVETKAAATNIGQFA